MARAYAGMAMRPLLATLAILLVLTFLPSPAAAQQQGSLTMYLEAPEMALSDEVTTLTFQGIATLTTDATAYASPTGIPVQYTITKQPAWATVTVSPSTDVFQTGHPVGLTLTTSKAFTITVTLHHDPGEDLSDVLEVTATTSAGTPFGAAFTGKGATPVAYDAPDEPCPEHDAASHVDWAAVAVEAADAYNAHQSAQDGSDEEVSVQTGGSSTLPMPWIVVGGFALIGAGVGLVLRRRLS